MPPADDAARLAADDRGSGPPLVLVHGLATTRVIWRRVVPLLEPDRRVISLDVPGFGASPPAGPGFALDAVAERIAAGLAGRGLDEPYDLVGHSLGGAVALTLAARDPSAIGRLVLVAPAGLRPMAVETAEFLGRGAAVAIPLRAYGAALADLPWGRRLLLSPGTADPEAMPPAEVRAMLAASNGSTRIAAALTTAASSDLRPVLAELPVPVGAVWGDTDRIIPPGGADTVLALRPGAPTRTVERTGHIPMMERPEAFVAALDDVLDALSHDGNTG